MILIQLVLLTYLHNYYKISNQWKLLYNISYKQDSTTALQELHNTCPPTTRTSIQIAVPDRDSLNVHLSKGGEQIPFLYCKHGLHLLPKAAHALISVFVFTHPPLLQYL